MTEHVLETVTGPDTLALLQQTLDQAWSAEDVLAETRMSIELAVSEIGSNIIEHSGDGAPVRLRMVVTVVRGTVTVTFTDDGRPAAVDLTRMEMPDAMSERGRGLPIVHRVLDELSFSRDDDGNRWTLVRRR